MLRQQQMTAEEFLVFAEQHPDTRFDFMDGVMVEVSPKRLHGRLQTILASAFELYTEDKPHLEVHTEVLHELNGQKFIPDVSVNEVAPEDDNPYFTVPALLVVEIQSDSQSEEAQRRKARDYIKHGTKMVVLVLPTKAVEVFRPGRKPLVLAGDDILDGDDVLPGFQIPVKKLLRR